MLKRLIFESLWDSGDHFNVAIDAMLLPTEIELSAEREGRLAVLLLGKGLPKSIPDMDISDVGFNCTLSFPGAGLRHTKVPWSGVYGIFVQGGFQAGWPHDGRPSEPPAEHRKLRVVR